MASYPIITFPNNDTPLIFNINNFQPKTVQSDNISTTSLSVLGSSYLNTLTTSGLVTCNNGLTVSNGTVSFVNGSIPISSINGANSRITTCENNIVKLQNATSGIATVPTISANILTINYSTNNNSPLLINPTANFSVVINNVPTTNLNAIYRFELFITGKFYCNALTVNSTVMSLTAVGGFANIVTTINASATQLIQTFTIAFVNNATIPNKANTEIKSIW
jgi:hypothetical protein